MQFLANLLALAWAGISSVPRLIADANGWVLATLLLAATCWVGAASWAATLAEKRGQSPILHFLLGLLLPFVYPFMLAAESDRGGLGTPEEAADGPAVVPNGAVPGAAARAAEAELRFGAEYFRRLQQAGAVTAAVPCAVRFGGQEVTAGAILEILPEVVVLEVRTADGKPQRVRVPYARIEDVTK